MAYSSFANHLLHMSRYIAIFIVLFILLPNLFLRKGEGSFLEVFFRNYIKSVVFFIVLGHLLILLKIFELLTLLFSILLLYVYIYRKNNNITSLEGLFQGLLLWIYDVADGLIHPCKMVFDRLKNWVDKTKLLLVNNISSWLSLGYILLFLIVFIYSAYLRFYDTLHNAAPAMSDSYVVIAWIKYLDRKLLFYDGIYPQGFHMYLDYLHKFSAIDTLYVVNYSGPLQGVFITLGIYFAVSRWTGQKGAGLLAAISFGILGFYLPVGWVRQAATNSQEFAFVFIMPALYFLSVYISQGHKDDYLTGSAAIILIGLVHSLAFAYVGLGIGVILFVAAIVGFKEYKNRIIKVIIVGIISVISSFVPIAIGLLMGKDFYGAAADFLVEKAINPTVPELNTIDYLAGAVIFVLFILLISKRKVLKENFVVPFVFIFGIVAFCLYYYGGVVTQNIVISTRSRELWGLTIPVILGVGWYGVGQLIPFLRHRLTEIVLGFCFMSYIIFVIQPQPIVPYKMEYDSGVKQYLRISTMLEYSEWMIVSQEEGYALAYGKGYHLMLEDFLNDFSPNNKELKNCPPDIFIYNEKKVFWPPLDRTIMDYSKYEKREQENQQLKKWIETYERKFDNISTFYEDENLKILHISQPITQEESFKKIWGI